VVDVEIFFGLVVDVDFQLGNFIGGPGCDDEVVGCLYLESGAFIFVFVILQSN
jgi:hypothetical protein